MFGKNHRSKLPEAYAERSH